VVLETESIGSRGPGGTASAWSLPNWFIQLPGSYVGPEPDGLWCASVLNGSPRLAAKSQLAGLARWAAPLGVLAL
jgi:hypothetical protein